MSQYFYDTYDTDYIEKMSDFYNIAEKLYTYKDLRKFYRFANKLFNIDRRAFLLFIDKNAHLFDIDQLVILDEFCSAME